MASSFCTVLDGAKTGKTILPERYSLDRNHRIYGTQYLPRWKIERDHPSQQYILSRQSKPPFVMDILREAAESAEEDSLRQIADHFNALTKNKDPDLIAPWQDAEVHTNDMLSRPEQSVQCIGEARRGAMEAIKAHVVQVHDWCANLMKTAMKGASGRASTTGVGVDVGLGAGTTSRGAARGGKSSKRGVVEFTHRRIETRQDLFRRMSREFVGGPPAAEVLVFSQEEVARLRASYAYLYDWATHGGTRFPWNVAFNELGEIKLRANKDFKPISRGFYEKMTMRRL
jgi:RNA-dependent RNA polymerase